MKKELASAVVAFIEALEQVPGTQLQHIGGTLSQLRTDLTALNLVPAELDDLIEEAGIAHAEEMAYYNGMLEPDWDEMRSYEEYCEEVADAYFDWSKEHPSYPACGIEQYMAENGIASDDELPF